VPTTLQAIAIARHQGIPLSLVRITPRQPPPEEDPATRDYTLHVALPRDQFIAVMRECDVYVSNSTEREGFGLPAMEAMACGLVCILSDIACYRAFAPGREDHCRFVPPGDATATAAALAEIHRLAGTGALTEYRRRAIAVSASFSHQAACARFADILAEIHNGKAPS